MLVAVVELEPLSRLGFKVTGIDGNKKAIEVAVNHSKKII